VVTGNLFGWTFFGWTPHGSVSLWICVVILIIGYGAISAPLRAARRATNYYANGGRDDGWSTNWDNLLWLGLVVLFFWLAYQFVPGVQELLQSLPTSFHAHYEVTI